MREGIPWSNGQNNTKGLLNDHGTDIGVCGRGNGTLESPDPATDIEEQLDGNTSVDVGPLTGAAGLLDHVLSKLFPSAVKDLGGLHEDVPALLGEYLPPRLERIVGRFHSKSDLLLSCAAGLIDHLAGCW